MAQQDRTIDPHYDPIACQAQERARDTTNLA